MLPTYAKCREILLFSLKDKAEQGHEVKGLDKEIEALPDSYDALQLMARKLSALPLQADWPYDEPSDWASIDAACDPARAKEPLCTVDLVEASAKAKTAFLSSVCGCILGKPLEVMLDLDEIRKGATAAGVWPLNDYVPVSLLDGTRRRHSTWPRTTRGNIRYVEPDDDINYTLVGMLLLEQYGTDLTHGDIAKTWMNNLPPGFCFGPERRVLVKAALSTLGKSMGPVEQTEAWVKEWNFGEEKCGALIRADAYGYACAGDPALAAELAFRDASFTHQRTGIYGTMFVAAAIACAFVESDRRRIFELALQYVPQQSRFAEVVRYSMEVIWQASDWLDAYALIHGRYREFGHCRIVQEIGLLMNAVRFAKDVGDGISKQVMQGADTDSFGATCGSILGAYFGPDGLEARWLEPFNNTIHTTVATLQEQDLDALANRVAELPANINRARVRSAPQGGQTDD